MPTSTPKLPPSAAQVDASSKEPEKFAASIGSALATKMRKRFLILHNPAAGRNRATLARSVADALRKRGAEADFLGISDGLPKVPDLSGHYDAIVMSGGDGSIRALANRLKSAEIPLGVIPNGTGNVLAQELALPTTSPEIADLLMHGPTHPIAGGTVNGTPFLLMFGAGFDGDVIAGLSRKSIQAFGKLAYARPVMQALVKKPRLFDIAINGRVSKASWILVSNAGHYAGQLLLTDQTNILEASLVAFVSRATLRRQRYWELICLAAGRLRSAPTISVEPVEEAYVSTPDVAAQIDGEPLPPGPYAIRRRQDRTWIISPAAP